MKQEFLKEWLELEALLRKENKTPLDYENELDEVDCEKLKVCRILRNYYKHNKDGASFIEFSSKQVEFLTKLNKKLSLKYSSIKSEMLKIKPITSKTNFYETAAIFDKYKNLEYLPIIDKEFVGVYTRDSLIKDLTCKQWTIKVLASKVKKGYIKTVQLSDDINNLSEGHYIVFDKNVYKGILII